VDSSKEGLKCLDVVKSSESKLLFSTEGGTDSITAIRNFWLHPVIEIGDTIIYYSPPPYYKIKGEYDHIYDYEGDIQYLVMEKEYLDGKHLDSGDVRYIESSWFTINRSNTETEKIVFSVNKNETGKERYFGISLKHRSCGDYIEVIQSAE
jgi:hypothetical protein